jgi:uncharacterized protein
MTMTQTSPASPITARGFHVMTKPIGPICNIDCSYCFYLEKEKLYQDERRWKMSDPVLDTYIRQYIESQSGAPQITFAWQGGEPTLLGVGFFRNVIEIQRKYASGRTISNTLQTNGILLDDEWCEFLTANNFLIGLSIDGPRAIHDKNRVDKQGKPTFDAVMLGLEHLKKHKTEFNTLTVVNSTNSQRPLEVYRFLKEIGSKYHQYIPLVERIAPVRLRIKGFKLAEPPEIKQSPEPDAIVTQWSVEPTQYGRFLCEIFDEWVRNDVGQTFVNLFDVALESWMGLGAGLCVFAEHCGAALAIEHNGDLYSCDHYVYPQYKLGNIMSQHISELANSLQQRKFGLDKSDALPQYCKKCEVRFACNGECPKHRFMRTPDGEEGLNYLCPAYKLFFKHIDPHMRTMCDLLRQEQPPALIMQMLREREQRRRLGPVSRNDPCPCGSGKKYKKCCGAA